MCAVVVAGGVAFAILATLNAGGYRYGASDQSFYIPAILQQLDPALFPQDRAVLGPQGRYFLIDELAATLIRHAGGSIEGWFLAGYALSLAMLYGGLVWLGRTVFQSTLAVVALIAAETLRHRIARTGVNTLEGYFHPRVLVFAVGVVAIVLYLRGRPWWALALIVVAGALHPSTAAFFVLLLAAAMWTTDRSARPVLGLGAAAVAALSAWMLLAGPWRGALAPMDAEWRTLLATKDYLFPPTQWAPTDWLLNLGTAAIAIGGLWARTRAGVAHPRERGLLAGAIVLLAGFVVTLPLVALGSALFVQLQISRVFWLLELLALVPAVWWLVDRWAVSRPARARAMVGVLVTASAARAVWVGAIEQRRDVFAPSLPDTDWTRALAYLEPRAHVLADPGHAWKYNVPVRVAGHDVYLEDVKDTAMALYARDVAERVLTRSRELGAFEELTPGKARDLAARYEIDYLISTATLDLPLVAIEGRFRIYRLR